MCTYGSQKTPDTPNKKLEVEGTFGEKSRRIYHNSDTEYRN